MPLVANLWHTDAFALIAPDVCKQLCDTEVAASTIDMEALSELEPEVQRAVVARVNLRHVHIGARYLPASGSGAGPPNLVNEQWCVVASQVAPSLMHQHWAAVEQVPVSMVAEPTHVCVMALQTSPPQVWPAPMQSVSFVHAIPGGGPTLTPGFTVPPPIRLLIRPTLLTDSSVKWMLPSGPRQIPCA